MLGLRGDFAVSGGFIEPDVALLLMQLILTEGQLASSSMCNEAAGLRFLSNPDKVGIEKLHLTRVPKEFLEDAYEELPATIGGLVVARGIGPG